MKVAVENFKSPVFPCALIAGDVVLLHLLHRSKLLPKVPVVFVDTLHLFPETHDFLKQCEVRMPLLPQLPWDGRRLLGLRCLMHDGVAAYACKQTAIASS
jgi:3'-phosphoadenosine 5'-phosphosulfate sulfotransferase (PAPS reductase)/FAD synthetase